MAIKGPGWPDVRGWAIIAAVGVVTLILLMIREDPDLLKDAGFMTFVGTLSGGTILAAYSNLFGGTKSGAETNKVLADKIAEPKP